MSLQRRILLRALRALPWEQGPGFLGVLEVVAQDVALASGLAVFPLVGLLDGSVGLLLFREGEYVGTVAARRGGPRCLGAEGVEAVADLILAPESSGHGEGSALSMGRAQRSAP